MKNKLLLLITSLIILSLFLACSTSVTNTGETATTTMTSSSTPAATSISTTSANWWDKLGIPQYGGAINLRATETSSITFDSWSHPWMGGYRWPWLEPLFSQDWTVDRNTQSFQTAFVTQQYVAGHLAKSWEQTDPSTITVKLKQGVYWQNKSPVNGRELKASDVSFTFNRMCGTGDGYTEPSPFQTTIASLIQQVTAPDDYTVVFKFKSAGAVNIYYLMDNAYCIVAPEWVALGGSPASAAPAAEGPPGPPMGLSGPLNDWKTVVGTGPWMLTGFVDGSVVNFTKNPDYWGTDERYPKNKLPYADSLDTVVIADSATSIAALRTGKIDILSGINHTQQQSLDQTNPELQTVGLPSSGSVILFNVNEAPFTDVRVRQSLNMAINRSEIAKIYFGGMVDGKPAGEISPLLTGYTSPYDQWPKDLQDEYTYNPSGAKALLAEAGYPNGFKTTLLCQASSDTSLIQLIKSELSDIGVDMEIDQKEQTVAGEMMVNKKYILAWSEAEVGNTGMPWGSLMSKDPKLWRSPSTIDDPDFHNMLLKILDTSDASQIGKMTTETDLYLLAHHWQACLFPIISYTYWQPSLKGYSGEAFSNNIQSVARWWKAK